MIFDVKSLFEINESICFKNAEFKKIKRGAWMGDAILQEFASKYLWSVTTEDNGDEDFLSKQRSKIVCNRTLALFLDNCTRIDIPRKFNNHSKGTVFELSLIHI